MVYSSRKNRVLKQASHLRLPNLSIHSIFPLKGSCSSRKIYMDKPEKSEEKSDKSEGIFNKFVHSFEEALHLVTGSSTEKKLTSTTVDGVVEYLKTHKPTNVIVMTGAGISTSAGIPDFRSPGTGLYDNLSEYNLSDPMDIFTLSFFKRNPEPFYRVAKRLFPKTVKPTPTHHFVHLLEKKGILRRWFTQNIDSLEVATGIPEEKVVEAHGSHRKSTCLKCKKKYDLTWIEEKLNDPAVLVPKCEACEGVVKPDITFFEENLPKRFFQSCLSDFPKCDFLLIMGTSLVVQPFASLITEVGEDVPRLLINLEPAGQAPRGYPGEGLCYNHKNNKRDVFWKSTCDSAVREFAEKMGWEHELQALINEGEVAAEQHKKKVEEQHAKKLEEPKSEL